MNELQYHQNNQSYVLLHHKTLLLIYLKVPKIKITFSYLGGCSMLIRKLFIKPFSTIVSLLYPLKKSENLRVSDVFKGYRSGTLVENGLR